MFVLFFIFLNQGIPENIATEKLEDKLQGILRPSDPTNLEH